LPFARRAPNNAGPLWRKWEEAMPGEGRPDSMSDLEWLVALEEIRQLKARRDRYIDAHDWAGYESLHAPDHRSQHAAVDMSRPHEAAPAAWTSAAEMMSNVKRILTAGQRTLIHHSYDPEIVFDTPTKARGIWAMTDCGVSRQADGSDGWYVVYGYYYETYEKRDGRWLFTERRWQRHIGAGSDGVIFPTEPVRGRDAFDGPWP
jgi:hypothetical protein